MGNSTLDAEMSYAASLTGSVQELPPGLSDGRVACPEGPCRMSTCFPSAMMHEGSTITAPLDPYVLVVGPDISISWTFVRAEVTTEMDAQLLS